MLDVGIVRGGLAFPSPKQILRVCLNRCVGLRDRETIDSHLIGGAVGNVGHQVKCCRSAKLHRNLLPECRWQG